MRQYIFILIFTVSTLMSVSCQGSQDNKVTNNDDYYISYEGNYYEDIIKAEVKAWQKVAKVMFPRVCDDTETQWASLQVDTLAQDLLSKPTLSNGEQLARLYEIQNMVAYGMSYFVSVIGVYTNPEAAERARMMMQYSYADLDSLKATNYDNAHELIAFEQTVYANFGLFMELGTQYTDGEPAFVANNQDMNAMNNAKINLLFKDVKDEVQAYRYSTIVNNTAFFMTFCPLTFWLAGSDFQQTHQDEYMRIGGWFDEQASTVNDALYNNGMKSLPMISISDFSKDAKQAAKYKATLINLLAEGILTIPLEDQ